MNVAKSFLLIASLWGIAHELHSTVTIETLFAPDDRPTARLIKEIDETHDKILAAVYYISDQKIIDALIRAHNRKVEVRIISDAQTSNAFYSKVHQLVTQGIPVFVQNLKKKPALSRAPFVRHRLMHDKFAIVNKKIWTGSFNWTIGANTMNFENVVIIDGDDATYKKFFDRFFAIERDCIPYVPLTAKYLVLRLNPILAQA